MVDVSAKSDTERVARAVAKVYMESSTLELIERGGIKKGDVLAVAQVAGIMAAKKTADLIPMCHNLNLTSVDISFKPYSGERYLNIEAQVKTTGKTGVEMEALTAVSVAALTVYDMCKAVDRWMRIEGIALLEKSGGKSGHQIRRETSMEGKVLAVCISGQKGEKKKDVGQARLIEGHGIEGDAHSGNWHRQISLLSLDSVDRMRGRGIDINYGDFAENLTVEGIKVWELPIGTRIMVGPEAELEVTQIGKECHEGCAIRKQVGDCVMPREGIFTRVIKGGIVNNGDSIRALESS